MFTKLSELFFITGFADYYHVIVTMTLQSNDINNSTATDAAWLFVLEDNA